MYESHTLLYVFGKLWLDKQNKLYIWWHRLSEFWSAVLADILLTLKANGVFSEGAFVTGWFSSYLFKLSNLRLCLETTGYAGECWFIWQWRRHCCWRWMLLHCAGVIIPITSVTFPPKLWPQLWAVLFGSRLPSDVTLNGLEALLWKAAAARVLWNYLLLRNQCDFMHDQDFTKVSERQNFSAEFSVQL